MKNIDLKLIIILCFFIATGCKKQTSKEENKPAASDASISKKLIDSISKHPPEGMVWIPRGTFLQVAVPQIKWL